MMRLLSFAVAAGILAAAIPAATAAAYLVDTGVPTGDYVRGDEVLTGLSWGLVGNNYCGGETNCAQWLAGEFTLNSRSMLQGVEGFFESDGTIAGTVLAVIYSDDGDLPGTTLFSAPFTVAAGGSDAWYGASGLHWVLAAGTYWVGFEVPISSTFAGGMVCCATDPLLQEAFTRGPDQTWFSDDTIDIGVRIAGRTLPEPSTAALFAAALLGLAGLRRRLT